MTVYWLCHKCCCCFCCCCRHQIQTHANTQNFYRIHALPIGQSTGASVVGVVAAAASLYSMCLSMAMPPCINFSFHFELWITNERKKKKTNNSKLVLNQLYARCRREKKIPNIKGLVVVGRQLLRWIRNRSHEPWTSDSRLIGRMNSSNNNEKKKEAQAATTSTKIA